MEINRTLAEGDERARCATLRQMVLRYGHRIGWTSHAAIAFAEGSARRPWKHCTSDQLAAIVTDLRELHHAFEVRRLVALLVVDRLRCAEGVEDA